MGLWVDIAGHSWTTAGHDWTWLDMPCLLLRACLLLLTVHCRPQLDLAGPGWLVIAGYAWTRLGMASWSLLADHGWLAMAGPG